MNKMTIRKFPNMLSPFHSFPSLFPFDFAKDFNELFGQLQDFDQSCRNLSLSRGFPKGDIFKDDDGNVVVELMLAGYSKDQLSVKVEDNNLTVSAVKSDEDQSQKGRSRTCKSFTRTFSNFANEWDLEKADVCYENGLLTIVVPPVSTPEPQVREIEIK